jgi:hypothetical protein
MINSIIGSIMNMKCDVYKQQNSQSATGAISRNWVYSQTIDCKIEPLKAGGALGRGDNKAFETSGNDEYTENFQLKMKSPINMSKRWRVSAVRSNDGSIIYKEIDRYGEPDMIFEVTASHAEIDPFGRISYYEITLKRVQVQNDSTD